MCPDSTGLLVHKQFSCFLEILDLLHKQQLLVKLQAQRTCVKSRDTQGEGGCGVGVPGSSIKCKYLQAWMFSPR